MSDLECLRKGSIEIKTRCKIKILLYKKFFEINLIFMYRLLCPILYDFDMRQFFSKNLKILSRRRSGTVSSLISKFAHTDTGVPPSKCMGASYQFSPTSRDRRHTIVGVSTLPRNFNPSRTRSGSSAFLTRVLAQKAAQESPWVPNTVKPPEMANKPTVMISTVNKPVTLQEVTNRKDFSPEISRKISSKQDNSNLNDEILTTVRRAVSVKFSSQKTENSTIADLKRRAEMRKWDMEKEKGLQRNKSMPSSAAAARAKFQEKIGSNPAK